jgi:hypothetical protein
MIISENDERKNVNIPKQKKSKKEEKIFYPLLQIS